MPKFWTLAELATEALKYTSKTEFKKNSPSAYQASIKRKMIGSICSHMPKRKKYSTEGEYNANFKYSDLSLREEALKYKTKGEFSKNSPKMYRASYRRGTLNDICSHMPENASVGKIPAIKKWYPEIILKMALTCSSRKEFQIKFPGAYDASINQNIMDEVCVHMKNGTTESIPEKELMNIIIKSYPTAIKLIDRKRSMNNRPHIRGFDIDIFVPELRRGIEFDGIYWHSPKFLNKRKKNWPPEDILNYHSLKDDYFLSKGIEILHIKEEDWIKNKNNCIDLCLSFLSK